jgi:hypothetical protein
LTVERFLEAFHHQSPPAVAFPEIDGAVHGFHSLRLQPVLCGVEEEVGRLLVVDAVEEAHAAYGYFIVLVLVFFIGECRYAADELAGGVFQDPPLHLAEAEGLVAGGVENVVDVLVERTDVFGNVFVKLDVHLYEVPCRLFVSYFYQLHASQNKDISRYVGYFTQRRKGAKTQRDEGRKKGGLIR